MANRLAEEGAHQRAQIPQRFHPEIFHTPSLVELPESVIAWRNKRQVYTETNWIWDYQTEYEKGVEYYFTPDGYKFKSDLYEPFADDLTLIHIDKKDYHIFYPLECDNEEPYLCYTAQNEYDYLSKNRKSLNWSISFEILYAFDPIRIAQLQRELYEYHRLLFQHDIPVFF